MAGFFETIVLSLPLVASPPGTAWHKAERPNTVLVYTEAVGTPKGPLLSVECENRSPSIRIYWAQPMAGGESQVITYAIDGAKPRPARWRLSTNKKTLGIWGPDAIPVVSRLSGKTRVWVRARNERGAAVEAQFDLAGLERAVAPVAQACRWPLTAAR